MSDSTQRWGMVAVSVGADEDAVLILYRDVPRYRLAAWLWQAAWDRSTTRGDISSMSLWSALEAVVALALAVTVLNIAAAGGPSAWAAAALTALLVMLISRWARARVAVQMPQWASEGMYALHRDRSLADLGTGGALTPETWFALCALAEPSKSVPDETVTAVREWAEARARLVQRPGSDDTEDLHVLQQAATRVEALAS